jgi:predicted  nucleic acid-binding Zn-ribbon protein
VCKFEHDTNAWRAQERAQLAAQIADLEAAAAAAQARFEGDVQAAARERSDLRARLDAAHGELAAARKDAEGAEGRANALEAQLVDSVSESEVGV